MNQVTLSEKVKLLRDERWLEVGAHYVNFSPLITWLARHAPKEINEWINHVGLVSYSNIVKSYYTWWKLKSIHEQGLNEDIELWLEQRHFLQVLLHWGEVANIDENKKVIAGIKNPVYGIKNEKANELLCEIQRDLNAAEYDLLLGKGYLRARQCLLRSYYEYATDGDAFSVKYFHPNEHFWWSTPVAVDKCYRLPRYYEEVFLADYIDGGMTSVQTRRWERYMELVPEIKRLHDDVKDDLLLDSLGTDTKNKEEK